MNKILLLSLMILLGVLAFALGLFSKDSSTELSQFAPKSTGEVFSKPQNNQFTSLNTLDVIKTSENTIFEIPDDLVTEIEQELFLRTSQENVASFKQEVTQVESENIALNKKLITLNVESKALDDVLEQLDNKLNEKLRVNNVPLKKRGELLKELEKQIQNLNH